MRVRIGATLAVGSVIAAWACSGGPAAPSAPARDNATASLGAANAAATSIVGTAGAFKAEAASTSCHPDTAPPVIHSLSASPDSLWPPNHKMREVSVHVNATDNCDSSVSCKITSVHSNEPVNGTGDGNTAPDWTIDGALSVDLRAERAGTGDGRVYTITVTCRDDAGNHTSKSTHVDVPHDQGR